MDHVRTAVHLDDLGFLPAIDQNAHGVADLESAGPAGLRIHRCCRPGTVTASTRTRLKRRRRWRNLAAVRVSLRFGRRLRVAFRREQSNQLYAERFASLVGLPLLVVLIVAGARGVVARKHFEALSVRAHVNNIHLQRRCLREHAGHRHSQKQTSQREYAHLSHLRSAHVRGAREVSYPAVQENSLGGRISPNGNKTRGECPLARLGPLRTDHGRT